MSKRRLSVARGRERAAGEGFGGVQVELSSWHTLWFHSALDLASFRGTHWCFLGCKGGQNFGLCLAWLFSFRLCAGFSDGLSGGVHKTIPDIGFSGAVSVLRKGGSQP